MKLLEFPHILPSVIIVTIAENPVLVSFFKVELSDGGLFHRGDSTGKAGVHYMYPAESQLYRIIGSSDNDFLLRFNVLPTA